MKKIRTVFFGTPDWAIPILEKLNSSPALKKTGLVVVGVVTAPDKPAGRGWQLTPPPVKIKAQELNLKVFQPEKLKANLKFFKILHQLKPDLLVVAAYGKIIPKEILDLAPWGAINLHGSILPRWRGPAPIQYALLNGDTQTGVTMMLMDEEMDHGPILASKTISIAPDDTTQSLGEKLSVLAAELLEKMLPVWLRGEIKPQPQAHQLATYSKLIRKADGKINWQKPAQVIERQIRAFYPWPGAWTIYKTNSKKKNLKIIKATPFDLVREFTEAIKEIKPGKILLTSVGDVYVATGQGFLRLDLVQPGGKTPISGREFKKRWPEIEGFEN